MRVSFAVAISIALVFLGCTNAFDEFAKKDSDDALYFGAQLNMANGEYDLAIGKFQKISTTYLSQRAVTANYAAAYAGRCGLNLINLADAFSTDNGATNVFRLLMRQFSGISASRAADCKTAETLMLSIAAAASGRTADENTFLVFLELAKIGAYLALNVDTSPIDGTPDVGYDVCVVTTAWDTASREVATAVSIIRDSLNGPNMPTLLSSMASTLTTACTAIQTAYPAGNFCTTPATTDTNATTITTAIKAIKGVIGCTTNPGLGYAAPATCVCP